jgi:hypothetical protein
MDKNGFYIRKIEKEKRGTSPIQDAMSDDYGQPLDFGGVTTRVVLECYGDPDDLALLRAQAFGYQVKIKIEQP